MKKLTKNIFIPPGSSEHFINFSTLGGSEYFGKNIFLAALCNYTPGYQVIYPEAGKHNILICRKGEFDYSYEKFSGKLKAGEILIMPAGGIQAFSSDSKLQSIFFLLNPDSAWGDPLFRHSKAKNPELIWQLLEKAASTDREANQESIRRPLGELLFALLKEELYPAEEKTIFQILKNKMQMHPQKKWTVEKMANFCGVSAPYFFALCRKYYGMPPFKLLKKFRLELAEELLLMTKYPIKNIAEMCGYEHPFAFSRSFRQATGFSPAAFRKNRGGKTTEIT